jgi:hypothetical protein
MSLGVVRDLSLQSEDLPNRLNMRIAFVVLMKLFRRLRAGGLFVRLGVRLVVGDCSVCHLGC